MCIYKIWQNIWKVKLVQGSNLHSTDSKPSVQFPEQFRKSSNFVRIKIINITSFSLSVLKGTMSQNNGVPFPLCKWFFCYTGLSNGWYPSPFQVLLDEISLYTNHILEMYLWWEVFVCNIEVDNNDTFDKHPW